MCKEVKKTAFYKLKRVVSGSTKKCRNELAVAEAESTLLLQQTILNGIVGVIASDI